MKKKVSTIFLKGERQKKRKNKTMKTQIKKKSNNKKTKNENKHLPKEKKKHDRKKNEIMEKSKTENIKLRNIKICPRIMASIAKTLTIFGVVVVGGKFPTKASTISMSFQKCVFFSKGNQQHIWCERRFPMKNDSFG